MKQPLRADIIWMRVLACLAVVSVHVGTDWTPGHDAISITLNQLARFGTPAFVFITSFLLVRSHDPDRFDVRGFFRKRVLYLLVPYVFVSLHYNGAFLAAGNWRAYFKSLIIGASGHLYFIPLLFQLFLIFLVLRPRLDRVNWVRFLALSCVVSLVWSTTFVVLDSPMVGWQWLFPLWLPYFAMGGWLATRFEAAHEAWKRLGGWRYLLLGGTSLLAVVPAFWLNTVPVDVVRHEILTSSRGPHMVLYSVVFLAWFMLRSWERVRVPWFAAFLASRSYGIYLIHPLVGQWLTSGWPGSAEWPTAISYLAVLALCLALVTLIGWLPGGHLLVGKPGPMPRAQGDGTGSGLGRVGTLLFGTWF